MAMQYWGVFCITWFSVVDQSIYSLCSSKRQRMFIFHNITKICSIILGHDCVTCSPHLKQESERIERVQRRYAKKLRWLEGLSYGEILRIGCNCVLWNCGGYTLTCVTALYLGMSMSVYQSSSSLAVQLRLEVIPIHWRHICNNVRSLYFAVRVINVWNSLPADSVDFFSFVVFKGTV